MIRNIKKDKRGVTLIELFISLLLFSLLLPLVFLAFSSLMSISDTNYNVSKYQLYGDEILNFIHNQITTATHIKVYSKDSIVEDMYTNKISCENNQLYLNGVNLYNIQDIDIQLNSSINKIGLLEVSISLKVNNKIVYNKTEEIGIIYLMSQFDYVAGEKNVDYLNPIIAYDTLRIELPDISSVVNIANDLRKNMYDFALTWPKLTDEERRELCGSIWASNDNFRVGLLKKYYSNVWPIWPKDENGKNLYMPGNNTEVLYLSPYIFYPNQVDNDKCYENIFVFTSISQSSNWNTNLIYDHDEQQWYYRIRGKWSCNKTWAEVKEEIHSDRWIKLELRN